MVQRTGGSRRKTRSKLKKNIREKGKISICKYFQKFQEQDRVRLNAEPGIQKGMYFPRFHNKTGIITGKQGDCYELQIKDGGRIKTLIVHPVHLKKS